MLASEVRDQLRKYIEMNQDEYIHSIFYSDSFILEYAEYEQAYLECLIEKAKEQGNLHLTPISQSHFNQVVMVTPSAKKLGSWQRTVFVREVPTSHRDYGDLIEVINDNKDEWFRQGLWDERSVLNLDKS